MKLYSLFSLVLSPYFISVLSATFVAIVVMRRRSAVVTIDGED